MKIDKTSVRQKIIVFLYDLRFGKGNNQIILCKFARYNLN